MMQTIETKNNNAKSSGAWMNIALQTTSATISILLPNPLVTFMDILQVTFMDIPQPRVPNFVMHEYIYVFKVHLGHVYWYVSKSIVPESIHEYMLQTPQPFMITLRNHVSKILFEWIHMFLSF